jgi:GR25 family glycosyltransferase involved in LPS biosynthesis
MFWIIVLFMALILFLMRSGMEPWQPLTLNPFSNLQSLDYDSIFDIRSNGDARVFLSKIIPNKFCSRANPKNIRLLVNYGPRRRTKPDVFNWMIDGEAHERLNDESYDLIVTTKRDKMNDPKVIYVPEWSRAFSGMLSFTPQDLLTPPKVPTKIKFCAFMYSNCKVGQFDGVRLRHAFFKRLSQHKRVDSLGKCLSNMQVGSTRFSGFWVDNAIERYQPYRFVIAFENTAREGYITEKIIFPLLAGCVPIYWGAPDVHSFFNPKRMISVRQYADLDACIQRVLQVENDPAEWTRIVQEPIIEPQVLWKCADWYFKRLDFYSRVYSFLPELACPIFEPMDDRWRKLDTLKSIKVINLDRSKQRWTEMTQRLERNQSLKNRYERFPAIDGQRGTQVYAKFIQSHVHKFNKSRKTPLTPGEVGVYLSFVHICYALIHDPQNDYYLILEDDVYTDKLQEPSVYAKEAPVNWDVLFLGANRDYCALAGTSLYSNLSLHCMPGNFACMIRKRAAQYYVNFALPIEVPIDEFQRMSYHNLNLYVRQPNVVTTDYINETTIH